MRFESLLVAMTALTAMTAAISCNGPLQPDRPGDPPSAPGFPVRIHQPEKLSSIEVPAAAEDTQSLRVACISCHSLRESSALPGSPDDLEQFHRGLVLEHGELSCGSCHEPGRHDQLRLADGTLVPMKDAMRLCGQCHGPQHRDYQRGSHGGMRGYWDRSRGPQVRNHCVDCHDPHAPAFAGGQPVFPPRDRFLGTAAAAH